MSRSALVTAFATACLFAIPPARAIEPSSSTLSFNQDVRPILVEHCFACHGADSAARKAGLRLDRRDDAIEHGAIVPGDVDSTAILDRIFSDDPDAVMPPPAVKKPLAAEQKEILKRWVAEGAAYEPHWSFIPPQRPELPAVENNAWVRTPIDRFVLARLEAEGLAPAAEADRRTLARRVALDLTGLPPEPAVVDAFVADPSPDAYERLVDGMLASLEWGEHRGRHWLDYARYADTHGIHFDNFREMWTYRQWVVNAFNRNVPFDQFTILQLAGDLVAHDGVKATPEQILDDRIASGFNRCNMTTNEGGTIPEEYLVLYTRDRTETTSAVWMGLTTGCAVCHDHKFDPLSQREFYELAAFFNNTTQAAMDGNVQDTPPILPVPAPEDRPRFAELEKLVPPAKAAVEDRRKAARPEFDAWIAAATPEVMARSLPQDTPLVQLSFGEGQGTSTLARLAGKETALPLAASTTWQSGPSGQPAVLLDGRAAELATSGDFEHDQPFTVSCWLRVPANDSAYAVVARMDEAQAHRGWDMWVQGRRLAMHLIHSHPDDAIKVAATDQLKPDTWTLVTVAYDGSGKAEGMKIFYDGAEQKPKVETNTFKKHSIRTEVPLAIGGRSKAATAHGVGLAGLAIWGRGLSAGEVEGLSRAQQLADVLKLAPEARAKAADGLYGWWLASLDEPFRSATAAAARLDAEMAEIKKRGTIAHVMNEKPEMPKAFILDRGEYDKRKDEVQADTPDALPAFPAALPRNRLGLAQWLLLQDHPLTSRVTVNRFWQEVFGIGLVRTSGDFGITGELPSHPELLDWLAIEFREGGWDVKKLFRLMVTSAAYRQQAVATPEKLAKDNANRLLSRGPRFRMDAEMVRDHALAASGLLVKQIGGPSVKPYQPDGVWEAVSMGGNTNRYQRDKGESVYRRSMYWFWKRSAPPASMDILNAPSRENCCVRRERTNTPLQALVTLNDPQFVEAARALADRALELGGDSDDKRLEIVAERLLARPLTAAETAIVKKSLADITAWYAAHPDEAKQLVAVGDSKPRAADPVQLASWTMLTNELMNLDEVLCK
jgi:cytochrome c553